MKSLFNLPISKILCNFVATRSNTCMKAKTFEHIV